MKPENPTLRRMSRDVSEPARPPEVEAHPAGPQSREARPAGPPPRRHAPARASGVVAAALTASRRLPPARAAVAVAAACLALASCATLQQIAALRQVDFALDRVADARLAGVALSRIADYEDLSALDVGRIAAALATGTVPLDMTVHVSALNPSENDVTARLIQMDWTLLLDDRETVAGRVDREVVLPPGVVQDIPIGIRADLTDFFDRNARDLVNLALAAAGASGEPTRIAVRAVPTIQTSLGPIRYPQPITIVSREIGGSR